MNNSEGIRLQFLLQSDVLLIRNRYPDGGGAGDDAVTRETVVTTICFRLPGAAGMSESRPDIMCLNH